MKSYFHDNDMFLFCSHYVFSIVKHLIGTLLRILLVYVDQQIVNDFKCFPMRRQVVNNQ